MKTTMTLERFDTLKGEDFLDLGVQQEIREALVVRAKVAEYIAEVGCELHGREPEQIAVETLESFSRVHVKLHADLTAAWKLQDKLYSACKFALGEAIAYCGEEENDDSPNGEIIKVLSASIAEYEASRKSNK